MMPADPSLIQLQIPWAVMQGVHLAMMFFQLNSACQSLIQRASLRVLAPGLSMSCHR